MTLEIRSTTVFRGPNIWARMPEHEVAALIGREEMQALPPEVPTQDDEGWSGMPMGLQRVSRLRKNRRRRS